MLRIQTDEELRTAVTGADPAASTPADLHQLDQRALADLAAIRALPVEEVLKGSESTSGRYSTTTKGSRTFRWVVLAAAACAVTAVAGITISQQREQASTREVAASAGGALDAGQLLAALGPSGAADYQPYASTAQMAAESDLVVTGRIAGLRTGRIMGFTNDPNGFTMTSIVIEINDPVAVQGTLPADSDGLLYVEAPLGAEDAIYPDDAAQLLAGTPVVAYLQVAWRGDRTEEFDNYIVDPDAGRPAGQPLYATTGPQALVLQAPGEQLVWPAMHRVRHGTLQQALPGGPIIGSD